MRDLIVIPEHALVEEQLKEQEAEGVRMPPGTDQGTLAVLVLLVAEAQTSLVPRRVDL